MRNPFRGASRGAVIEETSDLRDDQLDRLSGGIPHYSDTDGPEEYVMVRPELPLLAPRPSDDPDLWF